MFYPVKSFAALENLVRLSLYRVSIFFLLLTVVNASLPKGPGDDPVHKAAFNHYSKECLVAAGGKDKGDQSRRGHIIKGGQIQNKKVVTAAWGMELIQFLAALVILHQDDLKKRVNRITATWRNGCSGKMDDHPVHTKPNYHPTKMDVL